MSKYIKFNINIKQKNCILQSSRIKFGRSLLSIQLQMKEMRFIKVSKLI